MRGRFGIVPSAWLDREDVGIAELAVLTALSTYADKEGYCFPSQTRMADQLGRSQAWVSKVITHLVRNGLITRRQRPQSRAHEYTILYDNLHQPADVDYQPADIDHQPADTNTTSNNTINNTPPKPRSRSPMETGWTPRQEDIDQALISNPILTKDIMPNETAQFVDYWIGKGDVKSDWNAAYRNWLRNAARFATRDSAKPFRRTAQPADERRRRITEAALAEDDGRSYGG